MTVVMRATQRWQDAGRERMLVAGESYDLPDGVALAFVAARYAERVTAVIDTKPAPALENGRGRRR